MEGTSYPQGTGKLAPVMVDGESREIVEKANGDIYYEAENVAQLTKNILWFKNHPKEARQMGKSGRNYVITNYTR